MKRTTGLLMGLFLAAAPASAAQVNFEYDHSFDFKQVKTFTYIDTDETNASDSMMGDRIKAAIIQELTEGGLQQVDSGGDLHVTYHMPTKAAPVLNTMGYGYSAVGTEWGALNAKPGTVSKEDTAFTEGTLIIDAFEPVKERMVWRGTATVRLKPDPEVQSQQLEYMVGKISRRWTKAMGQADKKAAGKDRQK